MGNYKATVVDCNISLVTWQNLVGLQKTNTIFDYPLKYLIHLPH